MVSITPKTFVDLYVPSNQDARTKWLYGQPLQDLFRAYLSYYGGAKYKIYDLAYFLAFIAKERDLEVVQVKHWSYANTNQFVNWRLTEGDKISTVNRRLTTIKACGNKTRNHYKYFINPAKEVKHLSAPLPLAGLSKADRKKIYDSIEFDRKLWLTPLKKEYFRIRDLFLMALILHTGLRINEVLKLNVDQLSEDFEYLEQVRVKGRIFTNVYLPSRIKHLVIRYLFMRGAKLQQSYPWVYHHPYAATLKYPLFISNHRGDWREPESLRLSSQQAWHTVNKYGAKLGIKLNPHRLRHIFAVTLLDSCKDIRLVAQALNHQSLKSTTIYTRRPDDEVAQFIES